LQQQQFPSGGGGGFSGGGGGSSGGGGGGGGFDDGGGGDDGGGDDGGGDGGGGGYDPSNVMQDPYAQYEDAPSVDDGGAVPSDDGSSDDGSGDDGSGGDASYATSDVGHGGGGHGGGGHHGGGHHGGFRGGMIYGGPWYEDDGLELLDTVDLDDEPTVDDVVNAVVARLKEQKEIVGAANYYDLQQAQQQMNSIKQVTIGIAQGLLGGGQRAIDRARELATKYNLPDSGRSLGKDRESIYWKLKWHADELAKHRSEPSTSLYASGEDLKSWVIQAFIACNAAEQGQETNEEMTTGQMWADMWIVVGKEAAKLPGELRHAISAAIETVTGIPTWVFWVTGGAIVVLLGVGVYKLLRGAAPIAGRIAEQVAVKRLGG
jgi:hypothetical protein